MALPTSYKKLVVNKLTNKFREAVSVTTVPLKTPGDQEVLVKNRYVGINATDVNITAGRYFTDGKVPFDIGFEAVGEVVAIGSNVKDLKIGQQVGYMNIKLGAYAEYTYVSRDVLFLMPAVKPEYVGLLLSGLTAAIGLDKWCNFNAAKCRNTGKGEEKRKGGPYRVYCRYEFPRKGRNKLQAKKGSLSRRCYLGVLKMLNQIAEFKTMLPENTY